MLYPFKPLSCVERSADSVALVASFGIAVMYDWPEAFGVGFFAEAWGGTSGLSIPFAASEDVNAVVDMGAGDGATWDALSWLLLLAFVAAACLDAIAAAASSCSL